jgi:hypothetical protein
MVSNVQMMRDLYAALGRGDMPAVLGAMDPGIEWREAEGNPYEPSGKAWLGTGAVVQNLFMRLATEWDVAIQPESSLQLLAAVWRACGMARWHWIRLSAGVRCKGRLVTALRWRGCGREPGAVGE